MTAASVISAGSSCEPLETRLTVPGMRCAGCIAKIERGLVQFPGISAARVNLSSKRVTISHNESFDDNELIEALHNLGFEAHSAVDQIAVGDDHHRKALLRALAVAGFGMMNIMLLSVSIWSGADGVTRDLFHWLSALIAIPVVAYAGRPFFASALTAVRHKRTNMDVPISIGVLLATGLSIYETVRGGAHAYFDGAVMLLFFLLAGRALDASMRGHTRAGIGALLGRMGKSASVLQGDGTIRRVPAEEIAVGATMIVAAGEALAADGTVELGSSAVDNSMITGESSPEPVEASDKVLAGAINMLGPIRVRVTAVAEDTAIAEIARLMDEAGQSRGRYVRIADRVSRLYAPAVHTLAALALAGWLLAGAGWYQSLVIAIAVLIITCPCAMGLAVPAAQVVATGTLIKQGVLVKDGSALERLAEVDTVFFDKTGTLTIGEPVPDLSALSQEEKAIALGLAQASRHPMSVGLTKALKREGVLPAHLDELHELAGLGIEGKHRNKIVALRKPEVRNSGTACALMTGSNVVTIRFADPLRVDARETISRLIELGLQPAILSGDGARAVAVAAETLGMRGTAQLKPDEKLSLLQEIKSAGRRPLMIGDGLNDGPALAAAHASMAPGTASDASQQAADAVFIGERLMPVVSAVLVARRTMKIVRQNFGFAIGYNLIAVPLALAGLVTPLIAALAMSLSSLVVIANSLRLAKVSV